MRTAAFGTWISALARAAGYDIDGPRSGGKKELAEASGISQSSIGRILAGKIMPSPYSLEDLALALNVSVLDMLVAAEVISREAATS
ncbi:helix-turn-helix domain-containing protein [Streptomyces sp. NRRL F-5630]|uniref:helix-turn-helix domain-containing protein n=1 Tax=Streptomyces sp. NRRL F-5630 TaxID=1463864 RepID=UPI003D75A184